MSAVDTNFYKEKKQSSFYLAIGFLVVVVCVTLLLYLYVSKLEKEVSSLESNIAQIDNSITELKNNPDIRAYNIYEKNRGLLEKLTYESRVTSFVNHFKKNFIKYGVNGRWFSYSNGNVSVEMSAETNDNGYAYEKVRRFLEWYKTDEKALFEMAPISSFAWYDEIKFSGQYSLK